MTHFRQKYGLSERQACLYLNQPRSTQRRRLITPDDEATLTADIVRLASLYGRYGYRRVTALLRAEGWPVNHKRVERIWRLEGLKVPPQTTEAVPALAERRVVHPAQAVLAEPSLVVRLRHRPHP